MYRIMFIIAVALPFVSAFGPQEESRPAHREVMNEIDQAFKQMNAQFTQVDTPLEKSHVSVEKELDRIQKLLAEANGLIYKGNTLLKSQETKLAYQRQQVDTIRNDLSKLDNVNQIERKRIELKEAQARIREIEYNIDHYQKWIRRIKGAKKRLVLKQRHLHQGQSIHESAKSKKQAERAAPKSPSTRAIQATQPEAQHSSSTKFSVTEAVAAAPKSPSTRAIQATQPEAQHSSSTKFSVTEAVAVDANEDGIHQATASSPLAQRAKIVVAAPEENLLQYARAQYEDEMQKAARDFQAQRRGLQPEEFVFLKQKYDAFRFEKLSALVVKEDQLEGMARARSASKEPFIKIIRTEMENLKSGDIASLYAKSTQIDNLRAQQQQATLAADAIRSKMIEDFTRVEKINRELIVGDIKMLQSSDVLHAHFIPTKGASAKNPELALKKDANQLTSLIKANEKERKRLNLDVKRNQLASLINEAQHLPPGYQYRLKQMEIHRAKASLHRAQELEQLLDTHLTRYTNALEKSRGLLWKHIHVNTGIKSTARRPPSYLEAAFGKSAKQNRRVIHQPPRPQMLPSQEPAFMVGSIPNGNARTRNSRRHRSRSSAGVATSTTPSFSLGSFSPRPKYVQIKNRVHPSMQHYRQSAGQVARTMF